MPDLRDATRAAAPTPSACSVMEPRALPVSVIDPQIVQQPARIVEPTLATSQDMSGAKPAVVTKAARLDRIRAAGGAAWKFTPSASASLPPQPPPPAPMAPPPPPLPPPPQHGLNWQNARLGLRRDEDGFFKRPPGRAPGGLRWDGNTGAWAPLEHLDDTECAARRHARRRAAAAAAAAAAPPPPPPHARARRAQGWTRTPPAPPHRTRRRTPSGRT